MNKINVKTGIQAHSKDKSGKNVKNWEKKTNQNCRYEWKCNQKCEKKASTKDITDEKSNVYHFCQISTVAIVDFRLSAQTKLLTRFWNGKKYKLLPNFSFLDSW